MSTKTINSNVVLASLADLEFKSTLEMPATKRQSSRCSLRGEAMLCMAEGESTQMKSMRVQLRNISRTGLGFLVNEELPIGSIWRVSFVVRNHTIGQQMLTIRHCRSVTNETFLAGGQFCIEPGLLHVLGVDPQVLHAADETPCPDTDDYLSPSDLI